MPPAFRRTHAFAAFAGALVFAATAFVACDGGDRSSDPQQAALRSAQEAADAAILEAGELPGDWRIVDTPTPPPSGVTLGPPLPNRFDDAWRAWQACANGRLSGGFLGINRLASAQSEVNNGPDDASIVTASALFSRTDVIQPALDALALAAEECVPAAPGLSWEPGDISLEGDAAISERVQVTIFFRDETDTQSFDLIALREGSMVGAAYVRDAGDELLNEIAEGLRSELAEAVESLDSEAVSR